MRACVFDMKNVGVTPRVLADDLHLIATGPRHLELFEHAFDRAHKHLDAMSARLAPHKSLVYFTDGTARNCLRQRKWRRIGKIIKVLSNSRDPGAHINCAKDTALL